MPIYFKIKTSLNIKRVDNEHLLQSSKETELIVKLKSLLILNKAGANIEQAYRLTENRSTAKNVERKYSKYLKEGTISSCNSCDKQI